MRKNQNAILKNLALLSQVGIMMLVPIFGGVLLGSWLDNKLGTGHILLIVCLILGVGASFRNLYMLSVRQGKDYEDSESPASYVKKFNKKVNEDKKRK